MKREEFYQSFFQYCIDEDGLIIGFGDFNFLWKFWNSHKLSKYRPRLIIEKNNNHKYRGIFSCDKCGEYMTTFYISGHKRYCRSCEGELREHLLLTERQKIRKRGEELMKKFDDGLCYYGEICPALKAHKELLQEDGERLGTEFILKQINLAYENIDKKKKHDLQCVTIE